MHTLARRQSLLAGLPLVLFTGALLVGLAIYWLCPSLRLPAQAGSILQPDAKAGIVEASHYDRPWFDAARAGRIDILEALKQAHYPLDRQTSAGYTALILTAYDHQPAALEYLLQQGANACLADRHGNTALMGAIYQGELGIARRLLQTPCAIDQTNNAGESALDFAVLFGRLPLLAELQRHGANLEHRDARGRTPLQIAASQGNTAAVKALRELGAKH